MKPNLKFEPKQTSQQKTEAVVSQSLDEVLVKSRVVVCAGSGGVGKTTMAAALALRAARAGRRVLVLTVDPAQRLATALGLDLQGVAERTVDWRSTAATSTDAGSGELAAAVINSKLIFDDFVKGNAHPPEAAARIIRNRLYQQLSTTLAGSQEFTALERLLQAVDAVAQDQPKYDLVILDTPPTKHAIDFLTAPQRINSLFQDSITKWFFPQAEPKFAGLLAGLLGRSTKVVLKALENLTGGQFIEELVDFFLSMRSIQTVLRDRSARAQALLTSETTSFVVVTSFDAAKLQEAKYLRQQLSEQNCHLRAVIINRAFPEWLPTELDSPAGFDAKEFALVHEFFVKLQATFANRYRLYQEFASELGTLPVVRIPEYQRDIFGLDDLTALAERLGEQK
jgi:anion-transporting  ArsA/GET3 family ATPase